MKTITGENWREVAALPSRIYGLRGASLDNILHAIICAHHQSFQPMLLFLTGLKILEAKFFFCWHGCEAFNFFLEGIPHVYQLIEEKMNDEHKCCWSPEEAVSL